MFTLLTFCTESSVADELLTNLAEGIEASRSGDAGSVDDDVVPEKATLPDENVFTKSTDGDLSSSLNERIAQIASASGEFDDDTPESEPAMGMTGIEKNIIFANLLMEKAQI